MSVNILNKGLSYAKSNPECWKVVTDLYKAPTKANVIRHATTENGFYPHVMKTVDKYTGDVYCTTRSYRNAEITHRDGAFDILHTCTPGDKVVRQHIKLDSLNDVVAYFKEWIPKFMDTKYRPLY